MSGHERPSETPETSGAAADRRSGPTAPKGRKGDRIAEQVAEVVRRYPEVTEALLADAVGRDPDQALRIVVACIKANPTAAGRILDFVRRSSVLKDRVRLGTLMAAFLPQIMSSDRGGQAGQPASLPPAAGGIAQPASGLLAGVTVGLAAGTVTAEMTGTRVEPSPAAESAADEARPLTPSEQQAAAIAAFLEELDRQESELEAVEGRAGESAPPPAEETSPALFSDATIQALADKIAEAFALTETESVGIAPVPSGIAGDAAKSETLAGDAGDSGAVLGGPAFAGSPAPGPAVAEPPAPPPQQQVELTETPSAEPGVEPLGGAGDDSPGGGGGEDSLFGGSGDDRLDAAAGNDSPSGGNGADSLAGLAGNDALAGAAGADRLFGGAGDGGLQGEDGPHGEDGGDLLAGESGDDSLFGGSGSDRLEGGDDDPGRDDAAGGLGDDSLAGGSGGDRLSGGEGDDDLSGGSGNDGLDGDGELFGGPEDDSLTGGSGGDRLSDGEEDDELLGGPVGDRLDGGPGDDELSGGPGDDGPAAGSGEDRLSGGPGADRLSGGDGDEAVSGDDSLAEGQGDDVVVAGPGADRLEGGTGNDLLVDELGDLAADPAADDPTAVSGSGAFLADDMLAPFLATEEAPAPPSGPDAQAPSRPEPDRDQAEAAAGDPVPLEAGDDPEGSAKGHGSGAAAAAAPPRYDPWTVVSGHSLYRRAEPAASDGSAASGSGSGRRQAAGSGSGSGRSLRPGSGSGGSGGSGSGAQGSGRGSGSGRATPQDRGSGLVFEDYLSGGVALTGSLLRAPEPPGETPEIDAPLAWDGPEADVAVEAGIGGIADGQAAERLEGGPGDDPPDHDGGSDSLDGGDGDDVYVIAADEPGVDVIADLSGQNGLRIEGLQPEHSVWGYITETGDLVLVARDQAGGDRVLAQIDDLVSRPEAFSAVEVEGRSLAVDDLISGADLHRGTADSLAGDSSSHEAADGTLSFVASDDALLASGNGAEIVSIEEAANEDQNGGEFGL